MSRVYTVTAVYTPSGEGPSDDVQAICTTREAAEATVERAIREDLLAGRGWIGQDWSYRVDEYPLCITPNEARSSRKVAGEDIYYDNQNQ